MFVMENCVRRITGGYEEEEEEDLLTCLQQYI